jgi:NADP-dependent 3-hydroxy acid dehydrogenase YdfG
MAKETGAEAVTGDATDEALARRLLEQMQPDLVVLVAGAAPHLGSIHEQTWETVSQNWNVDAKSTFVWLKLALTLPMKPKAHVVVVSSGAAVRGSPVSGGYAPAKRAQWYFADYAATEATRMNRALSIHVLLPMLNASTELGRAGMRAYAERAAIPLEKFSERFDPPMTPAILGRAVVDMHADPSKFPKLAYEISGKGMSAI